MTSEPPLGLEGELQGPLRALEFGGYAGRALAIHVAIAIPAVIARFVTDVSLGMTVLQTVKPVKRSDLY